MRFVEFGAQPVARAVAPVGQAALPAFSMFEFKRYLLDLAPQFCSEASRLGDVGGVDHSSNRRITALRAQ
ncbi:hypothetical protein C1S80_06000 [Mycolicibacterium aubagnense]|nr:hypothetical protein C1S80_06000 [Mycolicibacterium aubagnense]